MYSRHVMQRYNRGDSRIFDEKFFPKIFRQNFDDRHAKYTVLHVLRIQLAIKLKWLTFYLKEVLFILEGIHYVSNQ